MAMVDADKTWMNFLNECLAVPSLCAIAESLGPETTAETLNREVGQVFHELYESQRTTSLGIGALTFQALAGLAPTTLYDHLKRATFMALYSPAQLPDLATTMDLLLSRNFTLFETAPTATADPAGPVVTPYNEGPASFWGIACSDSVNRASDPWEILDGVEQQASSSFADVYVPQFWTCQRWRFEPAERFEGKSMVRTRNPILFVNSVFDPITPMIAAERATAKFEGSALLKTTGHGVSHSLSCTSLMLASLTTGDSTECSLIHRLAPSALCRRTSSMVLSQIRREHVRLILVPLSTLQHEQQRVRD
jgi:hypothetical protein